MALSINKNTIMSSFDGNFVISLEVLKLVLVALSLIFNYLCLIGQPVPEFWLLWLGFWLLKHLVEIRLFFCLIFINWKIHCGFLCTWLWNVGLLENVGKGFISGHFAYFQAIGSILIDLSWSGFEHDLVFGEILVYGAAQFLHSLGLFVALVNYDHEDDYKKTCSEDYEGLLRLLHSKCEEAAVLCGFL